MLPTSGPGPPHSSSQLVPPPNPAIAPALEQLSRRHSPGNVLHEFARAGVLANLPSMISEAGEGEGAPGERPSPPGAGYNGPMGGGHEVLLQGFNWECAQRPQPPWYAVLAGRAEEMAAAGITAVWLPPPSASVTAEGYLPRDYECLNSAYGSEADLRTCIAALHQHGVKALADIVLNHRCAGKQDSSGRWNQFSGRYAWDKSCICSGNPAYGGTGAQKQGSDFDAAPNVDHTSERVRQDLKEWLTWLRRDVSFDGWRFDFVKGYRGERVREYVEATQPDIALGEFWDACGYEGEHGDQLCSNQDAHRQRTIDWIDATGGSAAAFDFTTKGILQEAVAQNHYWRLRDAAGKPPGVLGWWPSHAVTFVENHDTGSTQNHWPFPSQYLHQGYCYILTHPGTPCLFYDHLWTDGILRPSLWRRLRSLLTVRQRETGHGAGSVSALRPLRAAILELLQLRRRASLNALSQVTIVEASEKLYAATIDGKVAMKIGPDAWDPTRARIDVGQKVWLLAVGGLGFAVWEAMF
ncbi:hypothetical protein WJX81_002820 [Elliptochloris bilobata]|uniref:Alpha-amylase n=1 Tax=Elliptochloris bilobata TaxID=381761 RepID=A0AAW1QP33_9CHLO